MIVLDASAAIELLSVSPVGRRVGSRIRSETVHVPELATLEVAQVLRRLVAADRLGAERAELALARWQRLPLVRHRHGALLGRIWGLRDNLTAYDATYVALAERLDAPLLTTDERLAEAPGNDATVELAT